MSTSTKESYALSGQYRERLPSYPNNQKRFRPTAAEAYSQENISSRRQLKKWQESQLNPFVNYHQPHLHYFMPRNTFDNTGTAGVSRYEKSLSQQEYLLQGSPVSETVRALAINRAHWSTKKPQTYQFTNAMTSSQYQKPVTSVYGPMLRSQVYGVRTQSSRHGYMPAQDFI